MRRPAGGFTTTSSSSSNQQLTTDDVPPHKSQQRKHKQRVNETKICCLRATKQGLYYLVAVVWLVFIVLVPLLVQEAAMWAYPDSYRSRTIVYGITMGSVFVAGIVVTNVYARVAATHDQLRKGQTDYDAAVDMHLHNAVSGALSGSIPITINNNGSSVSTASTIPPEIVEQEEEEEEDDEERGDSSPGGNNNEADPPLYLLSTPHPQPPQGPPPPPPSHQTPARRSGGAPRFYSASSIEHIP